ncbi:hypothetical protein H6F93_00060 [Leptolyngbya sp. FACHB-671]|uniref:hypothetical protein n=1 Tax=Leptolyngbya sp. FACHB-671 TaxID=2692812 RepID=UPI0016867DCD|nr:hypothetical protein [Leptolyngbya sp. FACHB-671]MBD2065948.1 hypothetical protein [Leptolyngbya sp. FACHB-671]
MTTDTLLIVGPGGVGKSSLDKILRTDVVRIDPYRLRSAGPRNPNDVLYAHPKLRDELYLTYQQLGVEVTCLSNDVHWFPKTRTLFLKVRNDWQLLMLGALPPGVAKAEIFAPAVPVMMENSHIRRLFGHVAILVLNPATSLTDIAGLKEKTRYNCERRGDKPDSVEERVASIDEEAAAWQRMVSLGAKEYPNWAFPAFIYGERGEKEILIAVRSALLQDSPQLDIFFRTEGDLLSEP